MSAAAGLRLVGTIAARGTNALHTAMQALFWVGAVPLVGVLPTPVETKDRALV